jgi:hypothetical protein
MRRLLREYLGEFKKFDVEAATIFIYSTVILLFVFFLRRTHFILPDESFLERLILVGLIYCVSPLLLLFLFKRKPRIMG